MIAILAGSRSSIHCLSLSQARVHPRLTGVGKPVGPFLLVQSLKCPPLTAGQSLGHPDCKGMALSALLVKLNLSLMRLPGGRTESRTPLFYEHQEGSHHIAQG